jgi:hypothetical protein
MKRFQASLGSHNQEKPIIGDFDTLPEAIKDVMQKVTDFREGTETEEEDFHNRVMGTHKTIWQMFEAKIIDNQTRQAVWENGKYLIK